MSAIIERWRNVVRRLGQEEGWAAGHSEVPPSFFHLFRPSGEGLQEVFQDVAHGEEILERLREIYRIAGEGDGLYFIVRKPEVVPKARLVHLAEQHVASMAEIVRASGASAGGWKDVLDPLIENQVRIDVVQTLPPGPSEKEWEDLNGALYEVTGDFVGSLTPAPSDATLLSDALYYMACRYELVHHVLWPLYREATPVREPFQAWFRLWTLGAGLRFEDPNLCRVYSPGGSA